MLFFYYVVSHPELARREGQIKIAIIDWLNEGMNIALYLL